MKRIALLAIIAATPASAELVVHDARGFFMRPSVGSCKFDDEPFTLFMFETPEVNEAFEGDPYEYVPGLLLFCSRDAYSCYEWGDDYVWAAYSEDIERGFYKIDDAYEFYSQCIRGPKPVPNAYPLSEFEVIGAEGDLRHGTSFQVYPNGGEFVPEATVLQFIGLQVESGDFPGETVRGWVEFQPWGSSIYPRPEIVAWGYDSDPNAAVAPIAIEHITRGPDLNGDTVVDSGDLAELLAKWGSTGPVVIPHATGGAYADINDDGSVGAGDLAELLAAWSAP